MVLHLCDLHQTLTITSLPLVGTRIQIFAMVFFAGWWITLTILPHQWLSCSPQDWDTHRIAVTMKEVEIAPWSIQTYICPKRVRFQGEDWDNSHLPGELK